MKALFRCDVTKSGGAGHLIRSVSLAEQARVHGFEILFCGQFETPFAQSVLASGKFASMDFSGPSEEMAELASAQDATIVHCDDYKSQDGLHAALSQRTISFSTIEDGPHGVRSADLIIDPSPNAEFTYRQNALSATHLRGLAYVPLRHAISVEAQKRRSRTLQHSRSQQDKFRVLIILGGTDAAGATTRMVELWTRSVPNSICYAVLPGQEAQRTESQGSSEVHWLPPSQMVTELFSQVDAVITAAGTTIWEVSAIGLPAAVIQQAQNQTFNYRYATTSGEMLGLGTVHEISTNERRIQETVKQLVTARPLPSMADDAGAARIISEWIDCLTGQDALRIREARISDATNLFDWRNDVAVRAVSRNNEFLRWDAHIEWLRSTLHNEQRKLLVAMSGWKPIGTVRFDQAPENPEQWEISLTLAPLSRGQGLGTALLERAEDWIRTNRSGNIEIAAQIKMDNQASSRLFYKNGYIKQPCTRLDGFDVWKKRL